MGMQTHYPGVQTFRHHLADVTHWEHCKRQNASHTMSCCLSPKHTAASVVGRRHFRSGADVTRFWTSFCPQFHFFLQPSYI